MSDRAPVFAALDYGTGGGKCALFDAHGRCLAVAREPWSYTEVSLGEGSLMSGFRFDPAAFWAALGRCVRLAIDGAGIPAHAIRGVAATAQRLGTVLLDAHGDEIYAAPNLDGSGFDGALAVMDRLGLERAVAIGGHWPPFVSSLARLLSFRAVAGNPVVAKVLTLSDWIAYRLSGEFGSEPSNAGESLLLEVPSRRWSDEVLSLFDVDRTLLPEILEPAARIGSVTAAAAQQTGLAPGTPVFAGGADTQCALLGSGVLDADHAAAVLGTTTPVMAVTESPHIDPTGRLWTGCHVVAGRWTVESNAGDTGIAYEWLAGLLGLTGPGALDRAEQEIAALPAEPGAAYAFLGPQIFDLATFNPMQATGLLFRMPMLAGRPSRAALLRAFLESVACAVRGNLEQVETLRGRSAASVTLCGGMTRSASLLRAFARLLRRPLLVSQEPDATALGAAVLAAAGQGTHPSIADAVRAMVRLAPLPAETDLEEAFEAHYARWRTLHDQLRATSL